MANRNATAIIDSPWLGRSIAPFFQRVKSYFIQYNNEPDAGDRAYYALASAFCVCRKDGGLILKS